MISIGEHGNSPGVPRVACNCPFQWSSTRFVRGSTNRHCLNRCGSETATDGIRENDAVAVSTSQAPRVGGLDSRIWHNSRPYTVFTLSSTNNLQIATAEFQRRFTPDSLDAGLISLSSVALPDTRPQLSRSQLSFRSEDRANSSL